MRWTHAILFSALLAAAPLSADASPGRGPRSSGIQGILLDLARLEITNVEREHPGVEQAVQQQIAGARQRLLGAIEGSVPVPGALRATQRALRIIANQNSNSYYDDETVQQRMTDQIGRLMARVDQMIQSGWMGTNMYVPPPPPGQPGWVQPNPVQQPPGWVQQPPPGPGPGWNRPPQAPPPVYRVPLSQDRMAALISRVRGAFKSEQVQMIQDEVNVGAFFTCQQVISLVEILWRDDQVKVAAMLHKRTLDPQNYPSVIAALSWESDRQQLRQMIGN